MRSFTSWASAALAVTAFGASILSVVEAKSTHSKLMEHPRNEAKLRAADMAAKRAEWQKRSVDDAGMEKRALRYLNANSSQFAVDGTAIPDVDWDIGESYAGLLPISKDANETSELYFWFFPSENADADDEIMIWLNGGPGCSSLEGLLQENGPFLWQYGTYKPVKNPWAWNRLTNMVWIEQPVGTGFSQGTPTATSEADVAAQFMGFWENFIDTFELHNSKVYISGESYAGMYVPYIADGMLNTNNTEYFDVEGIYIIDPVITGDALASEVPAVAFVDFWGPLINLNSTYMDTLHEKAERCGYTSYLEENLVFPPKGPLPEPVDSYACDVWDDIFYAALYTNPCFDIYDVSTTCPILWDVLGFPGSFEYTPAGADVYFDRADVKAAINAPNVSWSACSSIDVFPEGDSSPPSSAVLPGVIERTNNTIIGHGLADFILLANGTLLGIQNMTWGGVQGFQNAPEANFYVPYHNDSDIPALASSGIVGRTASERGLTYIEITLAGHMQPQYAPSGAFRAVEFLLGRIDDLTTVGSQFTVSE